MRYTVTYEPVKRTIAKSFVCQVCTRKGRKQKTFRQTISPFNKNADGTVKTWHDIIIELDAKAEHWEPEPIHESCRP